MSKIVILKGNELSEEDFQELKRIFFESSSRVHFADEKEKDEFFYKYLGYYLDHAPNLVFVAKSEQVLGYVVGLSETSDPELFDIQPHLKVFESFLHDYPAHLHINLGSESRGLGVGSNLLREFENELQQLKIKGLHIMTGPGSRNISFYQRLGFNFGVTLEFQGHPIHFMGKVLAGR